MSRKDEVQSLITTLNRRLQKLKEQQALYGASVDASILIQIEDIEAEIAKLQTELADVENKTKLLPRTTKAKKSRRVTNWEKIGAIAGVLGVLVAIIGLIISFLLQSKIPISEPRNIEPPTFVVKVQSEDTNEAIPDAVVVLELRGKAPIMEFTDTEGISRFILNSTYLNEPAKLTIEATAYETRVQSIDLTTSGLPTQVQLKPKATPANEGNKN